MIPIVPDHTAHRIAQMQHLAGRHHASLDIRYQLLGHHAVQHRCQLDPDLSLLGAGEGIDDPVDGVHRAPGVQGGDYQMPGLCCGQSCVDSLGIPHFSQKDHIRCLTDTCPKVSEIYRGGIEAIPKGQYEAGQVLGMTKSQIFFKVVLKQVIKRITAPIGNEIITLVKDTSLASVIAIPEILMNAKDFSMTGLIWPMFYSAVFFLTFCGVLTLLFAYIEKKLDYYKG